MIVLVVRVNESTLVQFIVKSWERPKNDAEYTQVHARKLVVFGLLQWRSLKSVGAIINTQVVPRPLPDFNLQPWGTRQVYIIHDKITNAETYIHTLRP